MNRKRAVWLWLSAAVLCVVWGLSGRAQVTTGTISGTVTDSSGAVLPGANVEVLNEGTGISRTVVSDSAGRYSAPQLGVGNYKVTGSLSGFQSEVRSGLELTVGREAVVDLHLTLGAVTQTIEVTGEAPLVQTAESTMSYLVGGTSIVELPLNGRDMTSLVLLNPGVTYSPYSPANEAYNGFGKRLSISGARGEDNVFLMDGSLIADFKRHIPAGPSGSLMGVETTQEFQVLTSAPPAQYGRMLGGVFNAVSKSGTNQWHGDAFEFIRNSDLDSRGYFDPIAGPPPFRRNQFGATLGGPIKKDKTFFFVAFEGMRENLTTTTYDVVPTAAADAGVLPTGNIAVSPKIVPYLPLFPLPTPGGATFPTSGTAQYIFPAPKPVSDNFGQVRLDHQFSEKDSVFLRYTGSNSSDTFINSYPGFTQSSALGSTLVTLGETHVFSPTMLNAVHFHFNRVTPADIGFYPIEPANLVSNPGTTDPPELAPGSGITSEAGFDTSPTFFTSNRFTFQDDVTKTIGAHSLQFGGLVERLQFNGAFYDRYMGVWSFASLQSFLQAVPSTYRGSPPGDGSYIRGFRQDFFALYLQDNWRLSSKLTLNLGVRWEPYTVPTEVNGLIANLRHITDAQSAVGGTYWLNKSMTDIGPRVGLAWSPFASGKTSVRAGFGLLFEPNDPNLFYTQMVRDPPLAYDYTIPDNGHFPSGLATIAATPSQGPGYAVSYDNNKSPRVMQYNVSVQQQVGANNLFSIGYAGSRGIDQLSVENINMPRAQWDGVSLALPANAALVNPNYSQIVLYANNSASWYNGLLVSFQRRLSKGFQAQVSYTYSKNLSESDSGQTAGGVTTGGGYLKYANNMAVDYGLAGYNFKNVLTTNYSYDLPLRKDKNGLPGHLLSGWQLTGILTVQSGPPLSVLGTVPAALSALGAQYVSPNAVPGCSLVLGGPTQYFNPACYTPAGPRELGNVGRNTLIGPGLASWDPGLVKNTQITERTRMEFRAEFFNALNRVNLGAPATTVFTATGGPVGSAGSITTLTTFPRQIQFALKLLW